MKYKLSTDVGINNLNLSSYVDKSLLIVDYFSTIDSVLSKTMNRDIHKLYDSIIVTKNNCYTGTVSIKKLLEYYSNYKFLRKAI